MNAGPTAPVRRKPNGGRNLGIGRGYAIETSLVSGAGLRITISRVSRRPLIQDLLDRYALSARVAPGLWALMPACIAALALAPELRSAGGSALLAVLAVVGTVFLADLVRDRGKAAETELFARWGGAPTTRRLRHRSARDKRALGELHERIRTATGRDLPDGGTEHNDPNQADRVYSEAVSVLRERTRTGYPVVFAELTSYGRKRNTWAIRHLGRATSVVGAAMCVAGVAYPPFRAALGLPWAGGAAALELLLIFYWFAEVREQWVKDAAERYADALFGAAEALSPAAGVGT